MDSDFNKPHMRRCWNCDNEAMHQSRITPGVLCGKCGSQDTRAMDSDSKVMVCKCFRDPTGRLVVDYACPVHAQEEMRLEIPSTWKPPFRTVEFGNGIVDIWDTEFRCYASVPKTLGEMVVKLLNEIHDPVNGLQSQLTQLRAERDELKLAADYNSDFMGFMKLELAKMECLCGKDHSATMPMCWPELIRCIVAKAVQKVTKERDEAVGLLVKAHACDGCNPNSHYFDITCQHCERVAFLARLRAASQENKE